MGSLSKGDPIVTAIPRTISRFDAARGLACCETTVSTTLGLPRNRSSETVNLAKLARALQADPQWILDCIEGRDTALSQIQVRGVLDRWSHIPPRARLRKGMRYSARDLGLHRESVSPLAGAPDSNVLGPNGWSQTS